MPASPTAFSRISWHAVSVAEAVEILDTHVDRGLSVQEAAERLREYGPNVLEEVRRASPWMLLVRQFKNILIVILLMATALSAALGHGVEATAIGSIVLFAVLLGFAQEYRAERAMEALRKMAAPTATVMRGAEEREIPARDVVPGDVLVLSAGDKVPADARVIESVSLHTDEAVLTGESAPVAKQSAPMMSVEVSVADRKNIVHAGTTVTYGRGKAVVIATGMHTEFGNIAGLLQTVEESETPLQKNLHRVGSVLAKAAIAIVVVLSITGIVRGEPVLEMLIFGIALAVAVVPEALPAVVTISLAIGVQRMVKRHALVRRLPAVETLGSVSVICSDKTGTLTKDEMTVKRIMTGSAVFDVSGNGYEPHGVFLEHGRESEPPDVLMELLRAGVLCSDAMLIRTDGRWDITGDPTEGALVVAAAKAGLQKIALEGESPRIAEIPFTSETKRMVTLHREKDGVVAYAKGAPEVILDSCALLHTVSGDQPLRQEDRERMLAEARGMADASLRVLGLAKKRAASLDTADRDMVFLGLVGMMDPPRPEARDAVAVCHRAGITTVMMTGDHPATATAIARELGILDAEGITVTGAELDAMDEARFRHAVDRVRVYARVSPVHKLRVVTTLQEKGHVVAMTGDGVNDAPALKKADIGIAMGITGTDVTKEAAAMTLTDDNFASIVAAVEEGRGIFENIKKYLMYLLSANIGEMLLLSAATMAGMPLPLSAVQILFVNLATDGLPALALAVDPPEEDLMRRAPRNPSTGIFTPSMVILMITGGVWSMFVNMGVFLWALRVGRSLPEAMTMTFSCLVCTEFLKAYAFRSDRHAVFVRPLTNRWLNAAVVGDLALLLLVLHVPILQSAFAVEPLAARDWGVILLASSTIILVLETAKVVVRRWWPAG